MTPAKLKALREALRDVPWGCVRTTIPSAELHAMVEKAHRDFEARWRVQRIWREALGYEYTQPFFGHGDYWEIELKPPMLALAANASPSNIWNTP